MITRLKTLQKCRAHYSALPRKKFQCQSSFKYCNLEEAAIFKNRLFNFLSSALITSIAAVGSAHVATSQTPVIQPGHVSKSNVPAWVFNQNPPQAPLNISSGEQAASSYISLSGTGGSSLNHFSPHQITISSDDLSYLGRNYVDDLELDYNFGGSLTRGSRAGLVVNLTQTKATGNRRNVHQFYVGLADDTYCSSNDNGILGFAQVAGQCVGENIMSRLGAAASGFYTLNASELDVSAPTGSSVGHKFGLLTVLSGNDAVRGSFDDAAIGFVASSKSSRGWKYIFQFGKTDGESSTAADSTILGCVSHVGTPTTCPAKNGIDFKENWEWTSGGFPFQSPNFSVDGQGNIAARQIVTNTIEGNSSGNLKLSAGTTSIVGHVAVVSGTPWLHCGAGNRCTLSPRASDTHGTIDELTGGPGFTLRFAAPYTTIPDCVISSSTGTIAAKYTVSLQALSVESAGTAEAKFTYICLQ